MAEQLEQATVVDAEPEAEHWQRRRRRHRRPSPVWQFVRQHRFELAWGAALLLGAFLVFGPLARHAQPANGAIAPGSGGAASAATQDVLSLWLDRIGATVDRAINGVKDGFASFMARNNGSVKLGLLLLVAALVALPLRARWWLINRSSLRIVLCPNCGGSLHRVHRSTFERMASRVVPLRRYRCSRCHWKGPRIDGPTSVVPAARAPGAHS